MIKKLQEFDLSPSFVRAHNRSMRNKRLVLTLVVISLVSQVRGGFNGADDFNDNSKNVSLWGPDNVLGSGFLSETNSRLFYSSSGPEVSQSARPWILNYATYATAWDVQLDVYNSHVAAPGSGGISSFGLEVFNGADENDSAYVEIYAVEAGKGFFSVLRSDSNDIGSNETGDINAFLGSVRLAYDDSTHVLSSFYDADGEANGYAWTPLTTFGISGSGGTTNANWGMGASDQFKIVAYGYSENVAISFGQISGDNFLAIPEPAIGALLAVALLALSGSRFYRRMTPK